MSSASRGGATAALITDFSLLNMCSYNGKYSNLFIIVSWKELITVHESFSLNLFCFWSCPELLKSDLNRCFFYLCCNRGSVNQIERKWQRYGIEKLCTMSIFYFILIIYLLFVGTFTWYNYKNTFDCHLSFFTFFN